MPRDGTKNLIPANKRSLKEVKENGKKGGIKSGKSRLAKKTFQEIAIKLLETNINSDETLNKLIKSKFPEMNEKEMTARMAIIVSQYIKAVGKGDTRAAEYLRDTAGEKPKEVIENINPTKLILDKKDAKSFADDLRSDLKSENG